MPGRGCPVKGRRPRHFGSYATELPTASAITPPGRTANDKGGKGSSHRMDKSGKMGVLATAIFLMIALLVAAAFFRTVLVGQFSPPICFRQPFTGSWGG